MGISFMMAAYSGAFDIFGIRVGCAQPWLKSYVICGAPDLPRFVVIRITPLAAWEPYMADEASFNTEIDSTSWGLNRPRPPSRPGMPSMTINGEVSPIVLTPRIRIVEPS